MSIPETYSQIRIGDEEDDQAEVGIPSAVVAIRLISQFLHRRILIAVVTAVGALAGVACAFLLPERFAASTKILTPQQSQSSATLFMSQMAGSSAGQLANLAGAGLGLRNASDVYLALLGSRPVQEALIKNFRLEGLYHSRDMTDARKRLTRYTKISAEKSGIITITVTDRDKYRAAAMANAYTEQLRALTTTLAVTEAAQRRLFYEQRLKQAKDDLVAGELAFQKVQQTRGLVALDAQARSMIEELAILRAQISAKEVELQVLRSFSTDKNPELQLVEQQLASVRGEKSKLEQQSQNTGFGNLSLKDVPGAGLQYLQAQHELAYRQTLYDLLFKQYDAARLDESKEGAVIQVVESAIPPDRRDSPRRVLIVILFTMGGLIAACIYLLLAKYVKENPEVVAALRDFRSSGFE